MIQQTLLDHATANDVSVIALVETDGRVWRGAAGLDHVDHAADPRARFDMGSTAKTFEATVALQLVEEGRLSLDDRAEDWIPESIKGPDVLVRHLLNHTSGLGGSRPYKPTSPPGTAYSYSNLGYFLLADIVTTVTGRPIEEEIRDRILEPLELNETWISPADSSLPWLGAPFGACEVCLSRSAAGGPFTTTSDLARFFQALLGGELLGDELLAEMTEATPMGTELSAGLGLFRFDLPCGVAYGHGGETPYYTNQVLTSEDGSKILVLARGRGDWFTTKTLAEEVYCQAA